MTAGAATARIALLAAAWSATRLTRVTPTHAPVARALWLVLALDLARLLARELGAPVEFLRALYLGVPAASGWLAARVLLGVPAGRARASALTSWGAFAAWAVFGAWPDRVAFAAAAESVGCAAVVVQLAGVAAVVRRRGVPSTTETCALVLLAGDLAALLGAWRFAEPWRAWELNRWQLAVTLTVVWCVQWRRLRWTQTLAATSAPGSSPWARW